MAFGGVLGEEPLYYLFTRQTGADRLLNLGYLTSNPDTFVAQSCESTGESQQREEGTPTWKWKNGAEDPQQSLVLQRDNMAGRSRKLGLKGAFFLLALVQLRQDSAKYSHRGNLSAV